MEINVKDVKIQVVEYELTTGIGISTLEIPAINGYLEAIKFDCPTSVILEITHGGEVIYSANTISGTIQLRKNTLDKNGDLFNYGSDRIALYDELSITVKGGQDIPCKVKIIFNG